MQGANIKDYDHTKGQAFQGDVCIFRVPDAFAKALNRIDEIKPVEGRLILQEGEFSGHHHAIALPVMFYHDDALARELGASKAAAKGLRTAKPKPGSARLFRDADLTSALVRDGILTRVDLCVGFLEVQDAPMTVTHEEHDGIRLPVGLYYIGNQVESAGAEERKVQD